MKVRPIHKLLAFEEDRVWISKNWETLLEKYPEEWIAVKENKVIARDPDLSRLLSKLSDPSHTCIEFITREPIETIL